MSVHHVQALVMGFTQSGKTTLITRWVTGRLPTEDTKTLPFNGVKSVHIRSKKHHTKELVVVRFVDGSGLNEHDLRRICLTADVIVACMCVELNGIDEQVIKELNNIFSTRRPPIIVLGTMLDLRYNIQTPPKLNTGDAVTDEENGNNACSADQEDVSTGELTIENVTKHRVSFSVSMESRKEDPVDTGVMSEEVQCGDNEFERIMTSISESDGNTDLDVSSISFDIQTSAVRRKNPAFWSTESINGSLVTKLDQSHDSWSESNIDCTLPKDDGYTVGPAVHEGARTRRLAHTNSATEPETRDLKDDNFSYPKPLIETHFPLNLDVPLTVKHFPKQHKAFFEQKKVLLKSTTVIPFKEDNWFSEDEPDNISFREISSRITDSRPMAPVSNTTTGVPDDHGENAAKLETEHTVLSGQDRGHLRDGLSPRSASTPRPSVPPEDMNFHVNLDPEPVRLSDYDPEQHQMLFNINGYCREWTMADGLRLAKTVKGDTYMECSACTGQNLQEVFEYIARVGCKYNKKRNEKCSVS